MKKLFILTLALVMTLSLAACGGETIESSNTIESVSMVDVTTELGISLKLPSELTIQENPALYVNMKTGDSAVFAVAEVAGYPLSDWTEEKVSDTYGIKYDDVVITNFENGKQINGKESVVSKLTLTTPKGSALTIVLVMVTDGNKNYTITFSYGSDNTDGSLAKNLQACIDSITIK
ncbi:MAG TPA: hypothetical protein VIK78_22555 [Ruminiclostridium sp.]